MNIHIHIILTFIHTHTFTYTYICIEHVYIYMCVCICIQVARCKLPGSNLTLRSHLSSRVCGGLVGLPGALPESSVYQGSHPTAVLKVRTYTVYYAKPESSKCKPAMSSMLSLTTSLLGLRMVLFMWGLCPDECLRCG